MLQNIGIKAAFDPDKADFTRVVSSSNSEGNLFITKILHNAAIEVNEKGSEAAAATASIIQTRAASSTKIETLIDFICNRPFIYLINDKIQNLILFYGKFSRPNF